VLVEAVEPEVDNLLLADLAAMEEMLMMLAVVRVVRDNPDLIG